MEITQKEVINKVSDLESLRKWTRIWDCHEEPHGMRVVGKIMLISLYSMMCNYNSV